jgi:hypothetical protein
VVGSATVTVTKSPFNFSRRHVAADPAAIRV